MRGHTKRKNRTFLYLLITAYVGGMTVFAYLKLLGLKELNDVSTTGQEALLPLSTCIGLFLAFGIAFMELNVFNKWKRFHLAKFIVLKYSIITFLIVTGCVLIFILFSVLVEKHSFVEALHAVKDFLRTEIFLSAFLYLILFSVFLNVIKTIYDYLGSQALIGALLGKYSQPTEEDLTFLFIDLQASTSIAERMGHIEYSRFIRTSFQLLTESIQKHNATIYQFVGDEVVLLWPTRIARQTLAPVKLYFDFVKEIEMQRKYFSDSFGEVPSFKAAIHSGAVTVTEIETVRKDVVYHGDVLNTCARMLEQCSILKKTLLVSSSISGWLEAHARFSASFVSPMALRGKNEKTNIYAISSRNDFDLVSNYLWS
jgi:adenylate cyclase